MIAPSILSADFLNLGETVDKINQSEASWLHVDVIDGHFAPNITFGLPVLQALKRRSHKPLDVHLMIAQPDRYLSVFARAGAYQLTVHLEACTHLHRTLTSIRELGCKVGVAINPHTPVSSLEEVLGMVDTVCVMSVNPGFSGQTYITSSVDKIARLKKMILANKCDVSIQADGGVSHMNASHLVEAGADILVAGAALFDQPDLLQAITDLKAAAR